jgi:hypothetical protein
VLAENVISSSIFYSDSEPRTTPKNPIYHNNYKYSTLRAMMNGYDGSSYSVANFSGNGFIDLAFTSAERALITTSTVDNSAATTVEKPEDPTEVATNAYACANTTDKLFCLSYQDLINTSYGFSSSASDRSEPRRAVLNDYLRATGIYMDTSYSYYGKGGWWSRSPDASNSIYEKLTGPTGDVFSGNGTNLGIRPSFVIDIH